MRHTSLTQYPYIIGEIETNVNTPERNIFRFSFLEPFAGRSILDIKSALCRHCASWDRQALHHRLMRLRRTAWHRLSCHAGAWRSQGNRPPPVNGYFFFAFTGSACNRHNCRNDIARSPLRGRRTGCVRGRPARRPSSTGSNAANKNWSASDPLPGTGNRAG